MKWNIRETDADIRLMAEVLKINPVVARILANRGVRSKNSGIRFLSPAKRFMHDSRRMLGMEVAAGLVLDGIESGRKFTIYGYYDADGICATVIMLKALRGLGAACDYYIPDRESEGYGMNMAAVESLADADILITVDNGIAAAPEIERAKSLGMTVIIIDHHEPPTIEDGGGFREVLPMADAIVDPKQTGCDYPFDSLCAAGLCYKFAKLIYEMSEAAFVMNNDLLIFAMIATFCDVVDLVDENRLIAANGLALMRGNFFENIGLKALVKARNLNYNEIRAYDIGFILGPCINATGRLDSARLGVELFMAEDDAETLANRLVELNEERKALTADVVEKTLEELSKNELDKVLVIHIPDMHESIAGIVAGRVRDATGRPTILLTNGDGAMKGSARSIEGYNIFEEMQKCRDLFMRFGGHAMAAGVTLDAANIAELRIRLNADCVLDESDFVPSLLIDSEMDADEITFELAQNLEKLGPFGKGNRKPTFVTREIFTETCEIIGKSGDTMRITFRTEEGRKIYGVAFKSVEKFANALEGRYSDEIIEGFLSRSIRNLTVKMDIAYHLEINEWNGNKNLQIVIADFKL